MKKQWKAVEKMLVLSVGFTLVLVAARIVATRQLAYIFFVWNLVLAVVPLLISRKLYKYEKINWKALILMFCWLLFLPNAPYIITDLFHFIERPPVPKWFDLLVVTSAAWNGLILGIVSLLQVEAFLLKQLTTVKVNLVITGCLVLSAFGIYLGRFLRFNSWNIITDPFSLAHAMGNRFLYPFDNIRTWAFTTLFSGMLCLMYFTVKKLPVKI